MKNRIADWTQGYTTRLMEALRESLWMEASSRGSQEIFADGRTVELTWCAGNLDDGQKASVQRSLVHPRVISKPPHLSEGLT